MTRIISHRGRYLRRFNPDGIAYSYSKNGLNDNDISFIDPFVKNKGEFDLSNLEIHMVEVDVIGAADGLLYLGHDECQEQFPYNDWYDSQKLLVHCKNMAAVRYIQTRIVSPTFDYFFHNEDDATFTKKGRFLVHPKVFLNDAKSIPAGAWVVMPNIHPQKLNQYVTPEIMNTWGAVITDWPQWMYEILNADE